MNHETNLNQGLMEKVRFGDLPGVLDHLEQGANPNARSDEIWSALKTAMQLKRDDIAVALLNAGAQTNDSDLLTAAKQGLSRVTHWMIASGMALEQKDSLGHTPLLLAAENNHLECVQALLLAGADPFASSDLETSNSNALQSAANNGNAQMCQSVIDAARKKLGNSGKKDTLHAFLNKRENGTGHTALHRAAGAKNGSECVLTLLHAGADIHAINHFGHQPIHQSVVSGRLSNLEALLSHGASVINGARCGQTPFQLACSKGNESAFDAILCTMPEAWTSNASDGSSPLHLACSSGSPSIVEKLLALNADVNALNAHNETPLVMLARSALVHQSAEKKEQFLSIASTLLNKGCDLNVRNKNGESALYLATKEGNTDLFRVLVARGADIEVVTTSGHSIKSIAQAMGHSKLLSEVTALQASHRASVAINNMLMGGDRALSSAPAP